MVVFVGALRWCQDLGSARLSEQAIRLATQTKDDRGLLSSRKRQNVWDYVTRVREFAGSRRIAPLRCKTHCNAFNDTHRWTLRVAIARNESSVLDEIIDSLCVWLSWLPRWLLITRACFIPDAGLRQSLNITITRSPTSLKSYLSFYQATDLNDG